jgi:hypothetical protein
MDLQLQVPICHHVDVQAPNNLYTLLALTPLHFLQLSELTVRYDPHNNQFPPFTILVFVRETDWVLWETWTQLLYPITYIAMPLPRRAIFRPVSHWPLTAEAKVRYWASP